MQTRSMAALIAFAGLLVAAGAQAQSGPDVLKAKGCLNCHDADKKKMGPSMKDIAAKKAGKSDELVANVAGAKKHPKVAATEAEIKAAVNQMLSTK